MPHPSSTKRFSFQRAAAAAATAAGHPSAFLLAVVVILVWGVTGPIFRFSDTWQLVINTGTTIVTFLMVFLIQNAQNRDTAAMQIKLDELIRAVHGARNNLIDIEQLDEQELHELRTKFQQLAEQARSKSGELCPPAPPET
jgi:low affinity Fe/Cu permease